MYAGLVRRNGVLYETDEVFRTAVAKDYEGGDRGKVVTLTIPSQVVDDNGEIYSVAAIGRGLCMDMTMLKTIELPSSVKELGPYAFRGCKSLTAFDFPDALAVIGEGCFYESGLKKLGLPDHFDEIPAWCFSGCNDAEEIVWGKNVRKIGDTAFGYIKSLDSIELPATVEEVGPNAFNGCDNCRTLTLGSGLRVIGEGAFGQLSKLSVIDIPDNVVEIGRQAFAYCASLFAVHIGAGVATIGDEAFRSCPIRFIRLGKSVSSMGDRVVSDWGREGMAVVLDGAVPEIKNGTFEVPGRVSKIFVPASAFSSVMNSNWWTVFESSVFTTDAFVPASQVTMSLPQTQMYRKEGVVAEATVSVSPSGSTMPGADLVSSDNSIVRVGGLSLTPTGVGVASVYAMSWDGYARSESEDVTVIEIKPETVEFIDWAVPYHLNKGESAKVPYYVLPADAYVETAEFESLNPAIVAVGALSGEMYGVAAGTTEVKVTVNGTVSNSIPVIVSDPGSVESVPEDPTSDDNVLYDLQGRRVTDPAPGIYFRGGQKVVIR